MRRAVGFYWTLPVPWAGFRDLPDDIEQAAKASRTIRYQMYLVRRYAENERFDLIDERVFIELEPDRPNTDIERPLDGLAELCHRYDATLLFADFSKVQGWRSHLVMKRRSGRMQDDIDILPIWPDSVSVDGLDFDPHRHFGEWRGRWNAWKASREGRKHSLHAEIENLREAEISYARVADTLNGRGIRSLTGKEWTGESIRKFVARYRA